jgi:tRNA threonylcarbamoyladenosine biosynthesis protein TsaE
VNKDLASEPETRSQKQDTFSGRFTTRSAEETFDLAERVGARLHHGAVFLLSGDLGAGKTVFAKGLAAGLDIDPGEVTSPSFTLINIHEGRMRLYHIDLYRLERGASAGLGLEEILEEENSITLIEWAERLGYVPAGAIPVHLEYLTDTEREITIGA